MARALVSSPRSAADGRAARRARQEAARADAGRDQAHPPHRRHHDRLCHPRSERGTDDVGSSSSSCTRAGSRRSARRASSTMRRPASSSPTSSGIRICYPSRFARRPARSIAGGDDRTAASLRSGARRRPAARRQGSTADHARRTSTITRGKGAARAMQMLTGRDRRHQLITANAIGSACPPDGGHRRANIPREPKARS